MSDGTFIDPGGNPLQLLEELSQILEEAYSVRSRLLGLSKWKEAISGQPHDLTRVFRFVATSVLSEYVSCVHLHVCVQKWDATVMI